MRSRNKILSASLLLTILVIAPLLSLHPVSAQQDGGTLRVATSHDPFGLNPALNLEVVNGIIGGQIYNSLINIDSKLQPTPDLAKSWEISADGLTYTFHLRDNVKWHDGVQFTSADVKFTVENVLLPYHAAGKTNFGGVQSIETPDNYTVVFKLKAVNPDFIYGLVRFNAFIMPKHLYEGTDIPNNPYNNKPVGTGAFKFVEWVKGDHVTLVKNENYFVKGVPYLDGIIFQIIPDATSRVAALEAGKLDFSLQGLPFDQVKTLSESLGIHVKIVPDAQGSLFFLGMNVNNTYLSNSLVRQAIAHSVPKDQLFNEVWGGYGYKSEALLDLFGVVPKTIYNYNLTQANNLLDQAGYTRGSGGVRFTLGVIFAPDNPAESVPVSQVLADRLGKVGIQLKSSQVTDSVWLEKTSKGDYDLCLCWIATGITPSATAVAVTKAGIGQPFANVFQYVNPEVEQLYAQAATELNSSKRMDLYAQANEIVAEDSPFVALNRLAIAFVYSDKVGGNLPDISTFRESLEALSFASAVTSVVTSTATTTSAVTSVVTSTADLTVISGIVAAVVVVALGGVALFLRRKRTRVQS